MSTIMTTTTITTTTPQTNNFLLPYHWTDIDTHEEDLPLPAREKFNTYALSNMLGMAFGWLIMPYFGREMMKLGIDGAEL